MKTKKPVWLKSNEYDLEKEVLFITKDERFRITKITDGDFDLNDACKMMFSKENRPYVSERKLKKQEQNFRKKFEDYGAVIIILEKMELDGCYSSVELCGGFVGWDKFDNSHYYIQELKELVNNIFRNESAFEKEQKEMLDEQKFVAEAFSKFIAKCDKKGIDAEYTAYLTFCIIGGITLKKSPKDFYNFINEIISKNLGSSSENN